MGWPSVRKNDLSFDGSVGWVPAFVALVFIHIELHEIAHTSVGRLICGAWGRRDFNVWDTACMKTPEIVLAPIAGLVFSYGLMWIGLRLLSPNRPTSRRLIGFCLVFATGAFGRVRTVAGGGGDEMVILTGVFPGISETLLTVAGTTAVLLLIGPPLYRAFTTLANEGRVPIFFGLLLAPTVLFELGIQRIANPLLARGVLAGEGLLGSPLLVNVWTGFWLVVLVASWRVLPVTLADRRTGAETTSTESNSD